MSDKEHILSTLRKLANYYGKGPTKDQAEMYLEVLAGLEPEVLNYAVRAWIRKSPFFPRISELLQMAARYTPPAANPIRIILLEQYQLEREFYQQGKLDTGKWEALAKRFETHDRIYTAEACRQRLQHYRAILELSRKSPAEQVEHWKQHKYKKYSAEG
jgi:hypothetical protein